ncbi:MULTISPECIES: WXG100 family type VII secretion target [Streptomyces]|uniref:WXG100 family type VII secretion target n=1 Tax=Streptomyces luteosporeus TaxID=173856 RepID=A0ABN3U6U1_9ACTN
MSSDIQKIDDAAFVAFENSLKEASAAMSANLKSLVNAVEQVKPAWEGRAAQAFTTAQMQLNDDHDALRRLLDGIHDAVALTRKSSHANEEAVVSSFKSIDVNGGAAGGHLDAKSTQTGLSAGLDSKIHEY